MDCDVAVPCATAWCCSARCGLLQHGRHDAVHRAGHARLAVSRGLEVRQRAEPLKLERDAGSGQPQSLGNVGLVLCLSISKLLSSRHLVTFPRQRR